jgi:hypothetical protein
VEARGRGEGLSCMGSGLGLPRVKEDMHAIYKCGVLALVSFPVSGWYLSTMSLSVPFRGRLRWLLLAAYLRYPGPLGLPGAW